MEVTIGCLWSSDMLIAYGGQDRLSRGGQVAYEDQDIVHLKVRI